MNTSCPHCGQHYEIDDQYSGAEATCERCGKTFTVPPVVPAVENVKTVQSSAEVQSVAPSCPFCGGEILAGVKKCRHCGEWLNLFDKPKSPTVYVLLAFFFGMFGVHNFYSGAKAKGWTKLLLLFGAVPVSLFIGLVVLLPISLFFMWLFPPSSEARGMGMSLGSAEAMLLSVFSWLYSAIWCIVEMFHCREEIAAGTIKILPKTKQRLKWITFSIPVIVVILIIAISALSCSSQYKRTEPRVAPPTGASYSSPDAVSSSLPSPSVIQKGKLTLDRLEILAGIRKRRSLTFHEKKEAKELFAYMIDTHTVLCNDPQGRELLIKISREWGLK